MNRAISATIAVVVLAGGVGTFKYLVATKPAAKKSPNAAEGVAVDVMTVGKSSSTVRVRARGTVIPARQVVLGTEVGGKVIKISENLQPGGRFKKGDIIARIDPSDYRIAVEQSFAMVDSAQAQLSIEESRKAVATREWEMFGAKGRQTANKQLALREPQMRSATTQLKSARSGLKRARLGVERTLLRAPFDGMVQSRNVELGQIVGPGSPLLSFVGTHNYWVQVSIPIERLVWISVPGVSGATEGSKVMVRHSVGGQHIEKEGRVLRLLSEVDPAGRMARVLIEVDDPMGFASLAAAVNENSETAAESSTAQLPLLLGTYVEAEITGKQAEKVIELDRAALRGGNTVYIMKSDSTLEKRKIEVLWRRENVVLVSSGIETGESIVVSPLSAAVNGMMLRVPGATKPSTEAPAAPPRAANQEKTSVSKESKNTPLKKRASGVSPNDTKGQSL